MSHAILVPVSNNLISTIKLNDNDKHSIGRGLHNTTVIEDVKISRSHCFFEYKDGYWTITDTSTNGTCLNGKMILNDTHKLQNRDVITLSANCKYEYLVCSDERQTNKLEQNHVSNDVLNLPQTVLVPKFVMENFEDTVSKSANLASENQSKLDNQIESKLKSKEDGNINYAEDELQCSICTEMFVKAVTLCCSHTFCKYCIGQWCKNQTVCPICRAEIKMQFPTIVLDNFIDKIVENASEELKTHRKALLAERQLADGVVPGPSTSNTNRRRRIAVELIEISSSDSSVDSDTDELDTSNYDSHSGSDDECFDYNGLPGNYYGGYGSCYRCGQKGHWANGCPVKRRR